METTSSHRVGIGAVVRAEGELSVGGPLVAVLASQHRGGHTQTEGNN